MDNQITPMLAHSWKPSIDVSDWMITEKYDGVRAIWDGKSMLTRNRQGIWIPDYIREALPEDVWLDGELFAGRGGFQDCVSIVKSANRKGDWHRIRYMVFDAIIPNVPAEERFAIVKAAVRGLRDRGVEAATLIEVGTSVYQKLSEIRSSGGEGMMARRPGSYYVGGRSWDLLKLKTTEEVDGVVVGYKDGEGKNFGRVGALIVRVGECTFAVGTGLSDVNRLRPPQIGSIVRISYDSLSRQGIPRFPVYRGERYEQ